MPLSEANLARYLRRTMSSVEWDLWSRLRLNRLDRFTFRRKARVGPYIVDFACFSARVVVEVGGEMYDRSPPTDAARGAWLEARGFRVLRFAPHDIHQRMELVLAAIAAALAEGRSFSVPSARGFFRERRARRHRRVGRAP